MAVVIAFATALPVFAAGADAPVRCSDRSTLRQQVLEVLNSIRAMGAQCGNQQRFGPAAPVEWDSRLEQAAAQHGVDMAIGDFLSHVGSDGRTIAQRSRDAGYWFATIAENAASGSNSVGEVFQRWMARQGHCANNMNPRIRHIGAACVEEGTASNALRYWVVMLGAPR